MDQRSAKGCSGSRPRGEHKPLKELHTESHIFPLRQMEPDLTESVMSAFTVEGQCEHILVHTESLLLTSPTKFYGRGAEEEEWEEIM